MVSHYLDPVMLAGQYGWDVNEDTKTNYLDISAVVYHYGETY